VTAPRKGTEYVCGVCGTTLVVTEEGLGIMEDIVCCERPMKARAPRVKSAKAKKAKKRRPAKK